MFGAQKKNGAVTNCLEQSAAWPNFLAADQNGIKPPSFAVGQKESKHLEPVEGHDLIIIHL